MRLRLRKGVGSSLLLLSILSLSPSPAAADDSAPRPQPPARNALGFNALAVAIGRYGGDFEYLAAPHNVLVLNVHGDYASHAWPAIEYDRPSPVWGFGGEVGWRWFTQEPGIRGFFFGPSLIAGYYNADYRGRRFDLPGVGLAADIGRQFDITPDVFLTYGFGLQYLWTARYPADIAPGVSFVMGAGVDPRLLVTVGGRLR